MSGSHMRDVAAKFLGSCAGLGYFPFAPGTVTSFAAAAIFVAFPSIAALHIIIPATAVVFVLGLWASEVMEGIYGHDPSQVTIDEFAGQWVALVLLPGGWFGVLLGFIAFRLFDILKPEPVDSAQKLPGGWGVMVDDLIAGIYANLSVRIVFWALSFSSITIPPL